MTSNENPQTSIILSDLTSLHALILSQNKDDPLKPDGLNHCGDLFLKAFQTSGDDEDICKAIDAYKQAVACLPENDTRLGGFLTDIAIGYQAQYKKFGRLDDLQMAIDTMEKAVTETGSVRSTSFPGCLSNLGVALTLRFEHTEDLDDISTAIRIQQQAVQLTPDGHADLPARLINLSYSYSLRFKQIGELSDICAAIQNQQRAVLITPDEYPGLPGSLNSLGRLFMHRFTRTGDLDDISAAIRNEQRAIELTPLGHTDMPGRLNSLGISFLLRFKRIGELDDISEAIRNQQSAIQCTPDGHVISPTWLNNLGTSFLFRFEHTGDLNDISEAIRNQQQAVRLSDANADLPGRLGNLGASFLRRFERTGDLDDISEAIQNQLRVVQSTPDGHPNLPARLNNLGTSFFLRSGHTEDLDDISEAIRNQQRAVQLTPMGHEDLPGWFNNLGTSFSHRFRHTADLDDISEAIRYQQQAVKLAPDGHPELPTWLNNLGNSFHHRFKHTRGLDHDDISEAIRNQQRAVQLTPGGHPDFPARLNNLGNSFLSRFERTGNPDDISEAILNHQRAVQFCPDGHANLPGWFYNLGISFSSRFEHTRDSEPLSKAVQNFRLSATSSIGPPSIRLMAAKRWADLSQEPNSPSPSEVLEAHACIIQLLSLISGLENTIQRRHTTLVNSSQLSTTASATALSLSQLGKALEWLVEGRCIVWNQINQLRTPVDELRSHHPALAESFSTLSSALENAGLRMSSPDRAELSMDAQISLEDQARTHIKQARDWEQLLETIRGKSGFEDFLRPRKCADIMSSLPDEGPIVIINVHNSRCDALALIAGFSEPKHVPLPNFSYQEAERLAKGLRSHLVQRGVRSGRLGVPLNDLPLFEVDFPEILKVLWSDVVSPILEALSFSVPDSLEKLPRIWWCPTGPLAFLPIHAAGVYIQGKGSPRQCLSDFAVSSYIPTVNALKNDSAEVIHDAPTGLLMVSQPNTPGMSEIPFASLEVQKIKSLLETQGVSCSTLDKEKATVHRLLEDMELFPCIHLACHASQNMTTPLKSSIYLHDGNLELSGIMKKNLCNSHFAFLSACQTSKGDEKLSEEVVHLASGMLAAGYRSVVGTMWSILDKHAPDLAEFFYEGLLANVTDEGPKINGRGAARALHKATQRLRENISGSSNSFLIWVPYIHIGI